jgi:Ni/Fe-hydrogenase subunit HybB-like protein
MTFMRFFRDGLSEAMTGGKAYHLWMGTLSLIMVLGFYAYSIQFREGLHVTGMGDHVSWGLYISNFTFLVGLAAAAVMLVMPAYVLKDVDFSKAVLIGEGVAVAALLMCLAFVTVDMGGPTRLWHMMPIVGYFNFPASLLTWDVLVLNGYLALNLGIPFYILYTRYRHGLPNRNFYVPLIYISVLWAIGIHLVTAFLYAGLSARPWWNTALLGPRFLASAFAAGPAFIIIVLAVIRRMTEYPIREATIGKLALIATVAAQVNLIMLASEIFKEFYPTKQGLSATYLFFGLNGYTGLTTWIWASIALNIAAVVILSIHPLRRNLRVLVPTCAVLFAAIWIEKGMGLVVPGFIPSPLGEIVEYTPTWIELAVTFGIVAMGLFVFTALAKVAIAVELGKMRDGEKRPVPQMNNSSLP